MQYYHEMTVLSTVFLTPSVIYETESIITIDADLCTVDDVLHVQLDRHARNRMKCVKITEM